MTGLQQFGSQIFIGIKKGDNYSVVSPSVIPLGLEPRAHTLKVYCSTS